MEQNRVVAGWVTIRSAEYRELCEDHSRLKAIELYLTAESYPNTDVIAKIMGVQDDRLR